MKHTGIIAILIAASLLRLFALGQVPVSLSDDEIRETESAYAIARTGKDVTGVPFPTTFNLDGFSFAPVPIYVTAALLTVVPPTPLTARLSYAIAGILTVLVLYLFVRAVCANDTKREWYALASAGILAISPWHIHISRFAHEGIFPLLFYTAGLWLLVGSTKRTVLRPVLAAVAFTLGFYSYAAAKVVYVPLVLAGLVYARKLLSRKAILIYLAIAGCTIASFLYLAKYQKGAEYTGGRIFLEDVTTANLEVGALRSGSHAPPILAKLFHNKATYWGRKFLEQYSYVFSGQFLFTDGEAAGIYSLPNRGAIYLFELPLLLMGLATLYAKQRKLFWFILSLILIAPLPSGLGVSRPTYTHRSAFLLTGLSLLSGSGIVFLLTEAKSAFAKILLTLTLTIVIAYSLGNYLQQYYFEWKTPGGFFFSAITKEMAMTLIRSPKSHKLAIVGSDNDILQYAFYAGLSPQEFQGKFNLPRVTIRGIQFETTCAALPKKTVRPRDSLVIVTSLCPIEEKPDTTIQALSGEVFWRIYEQP